MRWHRIRRETGLVEHMCEHGVGHPNHGSALWIAEQLVEGEDSTCIGEPNTIEELHAAGLVHGCDGCCKRDDFPGTPEESLKYAHGLIRDGAEKVRLVEKDMAILRSRNDLLIARVQEKELPEELPQLDVEACRVELDPLERCFLEIAESYARAWSDDPGTKTGCAIVDSEGQVMVLGTNRLPPGVRPETVASTIGILVDKPQRYLTMLHAERDAILLAGRRQLDIRGEDMYLPWFPCAECAQAIIASGIERLVCTAPDYESDRAGADWKRSMRAADALLACSQVSVEFVEYEGVR